MAKQTATLVAADMEPKHPIWHVRPGSFVKFVENLKQEILDSKHDENLRTKPARLVYDLLKDRVR